MLKRTFTAVALSAGIFAIAAPAFAADMMGSNDYSYNEPVAAGPHDWSGNYVGAQVGASSSKIPGPFTNRAGVLGGVVAGKTSRAAILLLAVKSKPTSQKPSTVSVMAAASSSPGIPMPRSRPVTPSTRRLFTAQPVTA